MKKRNQKKSIVDRETIPAVEKLTGIAKPKGFVGRLWGAIYYTDGRNVFRASESAVIDMSTGYLIGRWECTVTHWNQFCETLYKLPQVPLDQVVVSLSLDKEAK